MVLTLVNSPSITIASCQNISGFHWVFQNEILWTSMCSLEDFILVVSLCEIHMCSIISVLCCDI